MGKKRKPDMITPPTNEKETKRKSNMADKGPEPKDARSKQPSVLSLVISRIFSIVSAESRSVHPWMKKHKHFPNGPYLYGYGYTVFSPQSVIHAEHLIRQKFLVEENRSMFNTVGSIRGLKDEGLIKAFATEQRGLLESSIERLMRSCLFPKKRPKCRQ